MKPPILPAEPPAAPATIFQLQRPWMWLVLLSMALLLALLPFSSYAAALPFIQQEWRMTRTTAAVVFSSYLVGYALASLLIVPLTDRYPAARVLVSSMALMVVGNLAFALLAVDVWSGALLRAVAGAGHVGAYIPAVRLVSERFAGDRRGRAVGLFVSAGYAGTTLSYSFMGVLMSLSGDWRLAYGITALAGVVGLALLVWLVAANPQDRNTLSAAPPVSALGDAWLGLGRFAVIGAQGVLLNTLAYALHTAELYLARLWFPLLLGSAFALQGLAPGDAAIRAATWSGPMFMMGMAGVFAGGYVSDRLGRTLAASIIFALSGLCSFLAGSLLAFPALLIVLGYIYGLTTAGDSAIYSTSILEIAPAGKAGAAQAVQSFIGFGVGAVLPVVAGFLLDLGGGNTWELAFGFNGLLAVAGVIVLWRLRRLPVARQMAAGRR